MNSLTKLLQHPCPKLQVTWYYQGGGFKLNSQEKVLPASMEPHWDLQLVDLVEKISLHKTKDYTFLATLNILYSILHAGQVIMRHSLGQNITT